MGELLGFEGVCIVEVQGHIGGLVLYWRNKDEVKIQSYSKHHIDAIVEVQGEHKFRLTGIYGEPDRVKRKETWDLIRTLRNHSHLPWCLIGDMNNVVRQEDKRGGWPYPTWLIEGFRKVLEDCDLNDMDIEGYPYTWERGHGTKDWIEISLDRTLVSTSFIQNFADARLINMEISTSDHSPILLMTRTISHTYGAKDFRFENAWLKDPMCRKIVEDIWHLNTGSTFK